MNITSINNLVFTTSFLVSFFAFLIYGAFIVYYGSSKKDYVYDEEVDYPAVTILIPSYNEEKVMEKRIQNILAYDYPPEKMRVIFIDDSNDSTSDIIKKYAEKNTNFELIKLSERSGYSKAVSEGLAKVETDIVVLNEAGSFPLPGTLKNQIRKFQNPKIGAVSGHSVILNTDEHVGEIETLYLKLINYVRYAESNMDTTIWIKGEATAYRMNLVKDIQAVDDTGSIDTSMAFMVRKKGYKTIYGPDVIFEEYAPSDEQGFRKQKMVRAANIMRNLIIFKEMLLNPKYGKFGIVSMPFYYLTFFVIPILIPIAATSFVIGALLNWSIYQYMAIPAIIILILMLLLSRNLLKLLIELEISQLKAIYQIFFIKKGHDKIERVESTRRA